MSSLMNAGKSTITNQVNRAFTKGLYGVDISQLQKKQQQKRTYKEQLRKQAEQNQRRKAQLKARQRAQDQKLQRKIQEQLKRQNAQKLGNNLKNSRKNSQKAGVSQNRNFQSIPLENSIIKNTVSSPQINIYKGPNFQNFINNAQAYSVNQVRQTYNYVPKINYDTQQDRYYQQQAENRLKRFKQTLDRKLEQVYRQIQYTKKTQDNNSLVDEIRRRLKPNSYGKEHEGMQKSNVKQFEEQYSQFYKIPKSSNGTYSTKNRTAKNLDYDSSSQYKSSLRNYAQQAGGTDQSSRIHTQRPDKTQYNNQPGKWGNSRNNNFLGNRQALDYKIDSMLSNIDNIIDNQNVQNEHY